jgi:hypothetical protein
LVKPLPFTILNLNGLESYSQLYGYQMTEEGLVYLEDWSVTPLASTLEIGGPIHLVISPALIQEDVASLDIRYFYALAGATALGWLLWLISIIRYGKLKRKFLKNRRGVL